MSKFTINNNEKLIRNGGRKAVPLTAKELERKIFSAAEASGFDEEEDFGEILYALCSPDEEFRCSKVAKDLNTVEFDTENILYDRDEFDNSWLGFHEMNNGLTFLGCMAGGDWEYPVCFAIYYDGKSLRGYVPRYCNSYNLKTKQAFGNNYVLSLGEEIAAYLGVDNFTEDDTLDNDGLIKDITSRVVVR